MNIKALPKDGVLIKKVLMSAFPLALFLVWLFLHAPHHPLPLSSPTEVKNTRYGWTYGQTEPLIELHGLV